MTHRLPAREWIIVALLSAVVLAGWLGSRGLGEPDEGRYGEIAREMALQRDWLIPHLNGVPHFQKPPLTYWITASFIRLFGPNEWSVRLTPALAGLGTILCTMYIAGVLYGAGCRWKAGLVLVASTGFFVVARLITTDMLLTFFITASVAGLIGWVRRGRKAGLCVFYIAMGLGFLTKGPLGIVIPAVTAIAIQAEQRRRRQAAVPLYWLAGLPLAILIGLSWYLALVHREKALVDYFFRYEFVDRIASNTHNRSKPVWYYPGTLAVGGFPWTGVAFFAAWHLWRRRKSLSAADLWMFGGWVAVPYAVLSLVVSKLPTYLLPLSPPLAIMVARWMEHAQTGDDWRRPARITAFFLAAVLPCLPALGLLPHIRLPPLQNLPAGFWVTMLCAVTSFLLLARSLGKGLPLKPCMLWLAGTWAGVMLALSSQADALMTGGNRPVRTLARQIRLLDPDGLVPVFTFRTRLHGLSFYLGRMVHRGYSRSDVVLPLEPALQPRIVEDEDAAVLRLSRVPAFLVASDNNYHTTPVLQDWRPVAQDGRWHLVASPAFRPGPGTGDSLVNPARALSRNSVAARPDASGPR